MLTACRVPTKAKLFAVKILAPSFEDLKQILNQDDVVTLLSPHVNEFHIFLGGEKKNQQNRWDLKWGEGQVALLSWKLQTEKAICFPKHVLILSFNCLSSTCTAEAPSPWLQCPGGLRSTHRAVLRCGQPRTCHATNPPAHVSPFSCPRRAN